MVLCLDLIVEGKVSWKSSRVRPPVSGFPSLTALGNVALLRVQPPPLVDEWAPHSFSCFLHPTYSFPQSRSSPLQDAVFRKVMSEAEQVPASAPEAASAVILDALNATDSNGTEALNATAKFVATPEGTALAYGSLVFMALLPIFFGALRSVTCSKSKVTLENR